MKTFSAVDPVALPSHGDAVVAQNQRLEIRFLGTTIRAEGIAGIIGAITIIGFILTASLN